MSPLSAENVNSLYQRTWWLEAVAPGKHEYIEIMEDDRMCARMPVVKYNRFGLKLIDMPKLTQFLGPWLEQPEEKNYKRLGREKELMLALIDKLPPFDYFCQNFHYSLSNWHPFATRGFECNLAYTHVINNLGDMDQVIANFDPDTRYEIRKARRQLVIRDDLDVEKLWELTKLSFGTKQRTPPYSLQYLRRVVNACVQRNACKLLFAEDAQRRLHAGALIVWDDLSAYYLVGGSDPEVRSSGAASLVIEEALKHSSTVTHRFDFEGSMSTPIERFFRGFGGDRVPFMTVRGYSRKGRILQGLKNMMARATR